MYETVKTWTFRNKGKAGNWGNTIHCFSSLKLFKMCMTTQAKVITLVKLSKYRDVIYVKTVT